MDDPQPATRNPQPRIIVLTAPSGAGKTTIARRVMAAMPWLRFSVSATTRPPRAGETDGADYHFLSEEEFRARLAAGELLEHEEVYPGRFYGTLKSEVARVTPEAPVLLDIDVKGARAIQRIAGREALVLFIAPPSLHVLEERLRARATETPESLRTRLDRARMEIAAADQFDAVVVNDELEDAVEETLQAIRRFLSATNSA